MVTRHDLNPNELSDEEVERYQYLIKHHPDLDSAEIARNILRSYGEEVPDSE